MFTRKPKAPGAPTYILRPPYPGHPPLRCQVKLTADMPAVQALTLKLAKKAHREGWPSDPMHDCWVGIYLLSGEDWKIERQGPFQTVLVNSTVVRARRSKRAQARAGAGVFGGGLLGRAVRASAQGDIARQEQRDYDAARRVVPRQWPTEAQGGAR
jgi:hypothetical protein